ncbi:RAD55 family ATPase [Ectobacillus ponti]|uniref:KaiC domain-containing protein n=1 Tax=Ectobacillus ponti TaxID=2961894 RepID=A0AA41X269_9BACI|nr:ATPase domain-containing protein [Ectobacillus ponti]MCP8967247.1 hypothetical protein [Ectobacillus ponti]
MVVETGIQGLDQLLGGGIPQHASVLVEGPPGSGKTIMGMQYIWRGVARGEPGIYIVIQELPEQLHQQMQSFGWNSRSAEQQGKLQLLSIDPYALYHDMLATEGLLERIIGSMHCQRLVIDGIGLFSCFAPDKREQRAVLYTLRNLLRRKGVTALLINEGSMAQEGYNMEHYMMDGVLQLRNRKKGRQLERTVEVLKMRGVPAAEGEHPYRITGQGIVIEPLDSKE